MKLFVLFLLGVMILDIGFQGNIGSFLAVFISPDYLQDNS